MGKYIHFTDEQKQRANNVDLTVFLKMQGETLLPSGREKRLQSNHSITVRGNEWFDHATNEGGLAIDFVQNFYGKSFPDAVTMLLNGEQGAPYANVKDREVSRKPFALPPSNTDMRRVFAYLIKHRLIDREVVSFFAREKLIYESKEPSADESKEYHNAIFVGYDENGVPRHAHKRGLYTEGKGFKGNIDNSNPCYSFHYMGISDRLYVFEAPIDLLSFITVHKNSDWKKHSYLALCGISEQSIFKSIENNGELAHVVLCLDHDSAGIEASEKIEDMLAERNLSCSRLVPCFKDWNEDLKAAHSRTVIPAEEHPQHQFKKEICEEILLIVKDMNTTHIEYSDGEQILKQVRNQNEHPAEAMKLATAVFLCLAMREHRQMGNPITAEEIIQNMSEQFRAYQNRSRWDPKLTEAFKLFSKIEKPATIIGETEKMNCANGSLGVALELLKATIKLELHEQKQVQATILKMA